jgi:OmpA-OmpF porin, OOP family
MSINILESMSSMLGGPVTRQASAVLGESDESTRSGLRVGVPALLAGLMRSSANPGDASNLFHTVTSNAVDGDIDSKLGNIVGNRHTLDSTLSTGGSLLSSVLGNRASGVAQAVSQVAGIKSASATSMLALVAPLLLGLLKKQVTRGGLDAGGLSSLLLGQRSALQKVGLDDRITNALGFSNLQGLLGSLPETTRETTRERITETTSAYSAPVRDTARAYAHPPRRRSWVPWVVGLAIAAVALAFLLNRFGHNRTVRTPAAARTEAPRPTHLASLPAQVYFEPGQADIDATDRKTLAEVASTVRASGTPVAVTGYTDRSGTEQQNLELAKNRADAVRAALISEGLPESRIEMKAPTVVTGAGGPNEARRVEIDAAR